MGKRRTLFLNISLALAAAFCIAVFVCQMFFANLMGADAIRELGVFYMSGATEQVSSHFETIIELRLTQVESIVHAEAPGQAEYGPELRGELTRNARSAGFEYLALYMGDGSSRMIYGSQITPDVPELMNRSVQGGKNNVCAGTDAEGTPVVLIGVPANYPAGGGETSVALVAGLPTSYLGDTLERSIQSSIIEYSIIRDDGSYVLQNSSNADESNYFDRIARLYETYGGKTPEQYAGELRSAMEHDTDYTSEAMIEGERWNIYCTDLPNSEWHLLLKISYNTLDETVHSLQRRWSVISVGGCVLIVAALLLIFAGYDRLTKVQMRELDEARQTAEQAQRSAERSNRAKNEFLSNMSHDIRTPMNGIMGMTSIAIGSLDDPSRVHACLKKIYVSSRHLLGLISDMLDMSKIESGKLSLNMEPISVREIMQNVATIIQPQVQEKNQNFSIHVHDIYHENICSDRVRLSQILLNILGNAVKFTPEGGSIEIELFEEESAKGSDYILSHLYIRDNGMGMSPEFQSRIFEAFAREDDARVHKTEGAGMGMAITKYIVDSMGGAISVESERGKGSCFHVAMDMEITAQQEKILHLPKRNVLVVDDDERGAGLACEALKSIGLHGEAASGREQAERLIAGRGRDDPYHFILLDWDIQGSDAIETVRELPVKPELPILILSDGEWDELAARSEGSGISGFISKPLFRSSLYYALRPFIETQTPQDEPEEDSPADLSGTRVLVAEDNELNWEIASEMLSEFGLELEWAENGQICVDKFASSEPGRYDAILMDLRMPVMTGFEAALAIRGLNRADARSVPIIAVSADTFDDDVRKCIDYGMNGHTAKPIEPEKVVALLGKFLRN